MNKKVILGYVDLTNVSHDYCWYTVVTQYNYEEKYAENILEAIQGTNIAPLISEIYLPFKYIQEERNVGKKKVKKVRKIKGSYSSYVFVKCILTETLWNLLRTTTGAAVILTTGGIPTPIEQKQIDLIKEHQSPEGFTEEEWIDYAQQLEDKYHITDETTFSKEALENIIANSKWSQGDDEDGLQIKTT